MITPVHMAVVLRLLPEALAEGRVVGHAEIVDTGERKPVHSAQELIDVLCALTTQQPTATKGATK